MPVWQQWYRDNREKGVELMSVAIDAQGGEKILTHLQRAGAEFVTVKDEQNLLGQLYGFKAVPNGFLIDENGVVQYKKLGGFDIRRPEFASVLDRWVNSVDGVAAEPSDDGLSPEHSMANDLFRRGAEMQKLGRSAEAIALWKQGAELEPDNWIIRKQVWAAENPGKFYDSEVDFEWQKEQITKGI